MRVFAVSLLTLVVSAASLAAGFAAEDDAERVILHAGGVIPVGLTRGGFAMTARGLTLSDPLYHGWNYLLPDGAELADGFVRARFVVGAQLDSTLMLRAQAKEPLALDGLALSVERAGKKRFALVAYRFTQGVARPLGMKAEFDEPANGRRIELSVLLVGPQVSATLVDTDTLETLAHLSFTDRGRANGRVGLRVHANQDAASTIELLTLRAAGAEPVKADRTVAGEDRLAIVTPVDLIGLPPGLAQSAFSEGDRAFVLTDAVGIERLRRSGVKISEELGDPGWWFYDEQMRNAKAQGPVSTRAGFSVNESYKDAEMTNALARAYAERFPDIIVLEEIGHSLEGRPILALKVSDNPGVDEDEPSVIFNASHHGSELMATEFAFDALQWLTERYKRDRAVRKIVDELEIWFVPMVNPDGNMHYVHDSREAGRKNARDLDGDGKFQAWEGVDLNRNYPFRWGALGEVGSRSFGPHSKYRGEAPGSEPEVQALMALYERERPVASVSFHTAATKVLAPYTIDGVRNPEPDVAWAVAEDMIVDAPVQTSRKKYEVARNLYSVDGVDQDWMYHALGTLAFLIEGPLHNTRSSRLRKRSIERTRTTWQRLLMRVHQGPRVYGRVTDARGKAIAAVVRIAEVKHFEEERWTARPRDGRFDRLLIEPGMYTVVAEKEGYRTERKRVNVNGSPRRVDLVLEEEEL